MSAINTFSRSESIKDTINWLLDSNPWTRYRTLLDLLDQPANGSDVQKAKADLLNSELVQGLINDVKQWFPQSITRHDNAALSHYKLSMLADFGLSKHDPGIKEIAERIIQNHINDQFTIRQTLPEKGKGFSKPDPNANEWHALPCDSPLLTGILMQLGMQDDPVVKRSLNKLEKLWDSQQGWFCYFFFVEGHFKKHQIGCPMAGLFALRAFSQSIDTVSHSSSNNAFNTLQYHKELGKSIYYFGRGKNFFTLKYPFVWYNALHLAEALTRFNAFHETGLVKELLNWIISCKDEKGRFTPNSMFRIYKDWDFANKKEPSPWITFLCLRILKRYYKNGEIE